MRKKEVDREKENKSRGEARDSDITTNPGGNASSGTAAADSENKTKRGKVSCDVLCPSHFPSVKIKNSTQNVVKFPA